MNRTKPSLVLRTTPSENLTLRGTHGLVDVGDDSWPGLSEGRALAKSRGSGSTEEVPPVPSAPQGLTTIDDIVHRLEAADQERLALKKQMHRTGVRVLALEQSIRGAVDRNDEIIELMERCLRELRTQEDRLASEVAKLAGDVQAVGELAAFAGERVTSVEERARETGERVGALAGEVEDSVLLAKSAKDAVVARGRGEAIDGRVDSAIAELSRDVDVRVAEVDERVTEVGSRLAAAEARLKVRLAKIAVELNATHERVNRGVAALTAELSSSRDSAEHGLGEVAREAHVAAGLARRAQTAAREAKEQVSEASADAEVAYNEIQRRLTSALDRLDGLEVQTERANYVIDSVRIETLREEINASLSAMRRFFSERIDGQFDDDGDPLDRYRDRWEEHLRVHRELQQQRSENPVVGP